MNSHIYFYLYELIAIIVQRFSKDDAFKYFATKGNLWFLQCHCETAVVSSTVVSVLDYAV